MQTQDPITMRVGTQKLILFRNLIKLKMIHLNLILYPHSTISDKVLFSNKKLCFKPIKIGNNNFLFPNILLINGMRIKI